MQRRSVTAWQQVGYSSGNLGKNLVFASLDYFLLFFLTEIWGMRPALAGLVILVALVWDGLADPLVGWLIDRGSAPFGRFRPYLLIGAPIGAATFALVFARPPLAQDGAFWWVLASTLLFRSAYTLCDVPHNALMARMASDPKSSAFVSGARFIFSSLGGLLIGAAAASIFAAPDTGELAERFQFYSIVAAIVFVATIWIAWISTRSVDPPDPRAAPAAPLRAGIVNAASNTPLLWLMATAFVQAATIPSFAKCFAYFGAFSAHDPRWSGYAILLVTLAQMLSVPVWIALAHRATRVRLLCASLIVCGMATVTFLIGHQTAPFQSASLIAFGSGVGGTNVMIWALLPEAIYRSRSDGAHGVEGFATGLFLLSLKTGSGLGTALLGLLFQVLGDPDAQRLDAGPMTTLAIICGLPVAGAILSCITASTMAYSLGTRPTS